MGCMLSVFTALFTSGLYFVERFASFTLCGIMCCALLTAAGLSIAFGVALGYHYSVAEDIVAKQKMAEMKAEREKDQGRGVGVTAPRGPPIPSDYGELVTMMSIAAATINATARRRRHNDSFHDEEYRDNQVTERFLEVTTTSPDRPFKLDIPPNKDETKNMTANSNEDTADISADKYDMASNSKEESADVSQDKYDMPVNSKEDMAEVSHDKYDMPANSKYDASQVLQGKYDMHAKVKEDTADASPDKYDMIVNSPRKYGKMEGSSMGRRDMDNSREAQVPIIPAVNWWRGLNTTTATTDGSDYDGDEYYDDEDAEEEERQRLKREKRHLENKTGVLEWLHKYGSKFSRLLEL